MQRLRNLMPAWKLLIGLMALALVVGIGMMARQQMQGRAAQSAESSLVDFTLEFILQQHIGGMAEYIETSGQPWVDAPPEASIIVYAPMGPKQDWGPTLDSEHALRVWWVEGKKVMEVAEADRTEAIRRYRDRYMSMTEANVFAWGYYEFGVVSVSPTGTSAEVYLSSSCGPLCGTGMLYQLSRDPDGAWLITNEEMIWIS